MRPPTKFWVYVFSAMSAGYALGAIWMFVATSLHWAYPVIWLALAVLLAWSAHTCLKTYRMRIRTLNLLGIGLDQLDTAWAERQARYWAAVERQERFEAQVEQARRIDEGEEEWR